MKTTFYNEIKCPKEYVLAIHDTLNVVSGKWKLAIVSSLLFEKKRFSEIQRNIAAITPRMLSKELKELEINGIISRKVYGTIPVTIEYQLTESGELLSSVVDKMVEWGMQHREKAIGVPVYSMPI
jgi:DNA-binding HxlR family transcriptional regulator